tara:strand:+ start:7974 stop:8144 length:171 start_codon:yes stop_codon:yes gene_type:complete
MKTLKIVLFTILFSLILTSCTDLNSNDEELVLDHTEFTIQGDGSGTTPDCPKGKQC